jgi:Flp pilus assembly pilin Flp
MFLRLGCWMQITLMGVRSRLEDEDGVIATEYVIVLVLVALAIVGGATYLGIAINNKLSDAGNAVRDCVPSLC